MFIIKKYLKHIIIAAISLCVITVSFYVYNKISYNNWITTFGENLISDFSEEVMVQKMDSLPEKYIELKKVGEEHFNYFQNEIDNLVTSYKNKEITFEDLSFSIENYKLLPVAEKYAETTLAQSQLWEESRLIYDKGIKEIDSGNYLEALKTLATISSESPFYDDTVEKISLLKESAYENSLLEIKALLSKNQKEKATELVNKMIELFPDDKNLKSQYEYIQTFQTNLVEYTGPIEHMFTHCLIAFPEIAFSKNNSMTSSYDADCITPSEFKKIIKSLYENDYILIDINILLDETTDSLKIGKLMLPEGKKPLIFSIDDVVYDARKMSRGMVDKLIVDDKGKIATYTKHSTGEEIISYDNEIFPILNQFCEENPDFSFRGARGTLALTGFQGILGYRTQHDAPEGTDYEKEKEEALKVVSVLKENGWNFGSHSYGHYKMNSRLSVNQVAEDTELWNQEVKKLIGDTKIFFFPYGETISAGTQKHNILFDSGFRVFCMVGSKNPYIKLYNNSNSIYQDRRSLDGYSLRNFREYFLPFFDANEVIDPARDGV